MASGDRLQVVLEARDEMTQEIRQAQKSIKALEAEQKGYAQAAESGNKDAARSYERVRQEILQHKDALERVKAEQKLVAAEARKVATEQAKTAMKARMAAKEQQQQVAKVSASMGKLGDKIGLQGRSWDKVADKSVAYRRKWESALERVGLKAKQTNRDIEGGGKRGKGGLGAVGLVAGGAVAGATAAVMGLSTAFYSLSGAVNEARTARQAMAQTEAVMRSMGRTEAPERLTRMIDRLEAMSGIDGDNLREMTNVMLTFGNVTDDTLIRANELALDVSVAFGKDLQSSAVMVGKALNDPVKGLSALNRIGVQFTQEQQDQVKAMMATNDLAGAQGIIMAELGRQVDGSAKAQADGIAKTQVAWGNFKEAVGEVIMSISTGMGGDIPGAIRSATKAITDNKYMIVSVLQQIIGVVFKVISVWLKWQSIALKAFGYIIGGIASLLQAMAWLDPSMQGAADNAKGLAKGFGDASEAANTASKFFNDASTNARNAATRTGDLARALKQIDGRKARATVEVAITGVWDAVDAAVSKATDYASNLPTKKPKGSRWMGGPVSAGTWNVGELGPELFVPKSGRPSVVGADGPEIRDFDRSGFIVPNHLLEAGASQSTMVRERVVVESAPRGPLVENLVVRSEADAMRELQRMMDREERIARERR